MKEYEEALHRLNGSQFFSAKEQFFSAQCTDNFEAIPLDSGPLFVTKKISVCTC